MLKSLAVTNFALLEQTVIEFAEGLNVLTGETGAGKSIIIDALGMIFGGRASVESIRTGADYFRLEAVCDVSHLPEVLEFLDEQAIPVEEGTVIISRRLSRHGKNSVLVNGCHVTLQVLRQLGDKMLDMHGQHENQQLLRPEFHLSLLDSLDPLIGAKLEEYQQHYQRWQRLAAEQARLEGSTREQEQRIDMLTWQTGEIAAAALKADEEEQLEKEVRILANAEKIANAVARAYGLLQQGVKGYGAVLPALAEAKKELEAAVRYDDKVQAALTSVTDALYQLEDAAAELRDYRDSVDYDPQRLGTLQSRLDVIYKLKRKYGSSIEEILAYYEQARQELNEINNFDQRLAEITAARKAEEEQLTVAAEALRRLRTQAAQTFEQQITQHLTDLGMPKAKFIIKVLPLKHFTAQGQDEVQLLFSANPGEEPKLLYKIASGGELSRIALAIKASCAKRYNVGTMVFDEVDAGIGGKTVQMVAEKIALLALSRQVLCITHSAQMACMADRHIYIEKHVAGERTTTEVRVLNESERLLELTRMIAGDHITKLAMDNAAEMLKTANRNKEIWENKALA